MLEVRRDGAGCHPVTFLNFENHPTPFLMDILGWDAIPVHNKLMEILFYFPPINKLLKTILKFDNYKTLRLFFCILNKKLPSNKKRQLAFFFVKVSLEFFLVK